jgi:hypothetical protein
MTPRADLFFLKDDDFESSNARNLEDGNFGLWRITEACGVLPKFENYSDCDNSLENVYPSEKDPVAGRETA